MARYLVVFEKGPRNWSAYSPDVPGCVSTGATREDVARNIQEALELHLAGLREEGLPVPAGTVEDIDDFALGLVDVA